VLQVVRGRTDAANKGDWVAPAAFGDYALPTVMKKVAKLVAAAAA